MWYEINEIRIMYTDKFVCQKKSNGFTLLEILVALSILSLIMAVLFTSLGSSATHAKRIRERLEAQQMLRLAMQRIAADFEGVYWRKDKEHLFFLGKQENGQRGREDKIEFTAIRPRWNSSGNRNELVSISYNLRSLSKGKGLTREEKSIWGYRDIGSSKPVTLLEGIQELKFEYIDRENRKYEFWSTKGTDDKTSLPAAIRITVKMKRDDGTFQIFSTVMPIPAGLHEPGLSPKGTVESGSGLFIPNGSIGSDNSSPTKTGKIN